MNKKDFRFVMISVVLIAGILIYYFGHVQLGKELSQLNAKKSAAQEMYESTMEKAEALNNIAEDIAGYRKDIARVTKAYYGDIDQEDYIVHVGQFLGASGITANSIIYVGDMELEIEAPVNAASDGTGIEEMPVEHNAVARYCAYKLQFECAYDELTTLLALVEQSGEKLTCSNITMVPVLAPAVLEVAVPEDGEEVREIVNCEMQLAFYYFENLAEFTIEHDYSDILDNEPVEGRKNVFSF